MLRFPKQIFNTVTMLKKLVVAEVNKIIDQTLQIVEIVCVVLTTIQMA